MTRVLNLPQRLCGVVDTCEFYFSLPYRNDYITFNWYGNKIKNTYFDSLRIVKYYYVHNIMWAAPTLYYDIGGYRIL